ncbi:MAG TPA: glycosyltransferase, partial [Gaiellaceae bacterium]|nr:glycosyltransferase [Gaiellaceae bacterium]
PEADLPDLYRAADVSVVPSLELEGFGLTVLESLACGTPVIATTGGGPAEALAPLDRSLLVPPGDTDALADRLRSAREGALPDTRACRAHAERFSWHRAAALNREAYARVLTPVPQSIRAVYLDHCARLSGAELALSRLLPELEGVDSHVILGEDGPLVDVLLERGLSVEVLAMPTAARDLPRARVRLTGVSLGTIAGTATYILRLTWRLRALKPDLVHTNSLKAAIYGTAAAKLAGVPLVWHVRDRIAEDYLPPAAVRLVQRLAASPSLVFANSAATMATVGDAAQRRAIIPSVVLFDPVATPTASIASAQEGFTVGMVGRLASWKGQHIFLEAFARAFSDGDERAVIVGAPLFGEDEYERQLRDLARELGIEQRVEFAGHRRDVYAELSRFDVLVHASVTPEPFGQVVLEGMAAGLPVVASAAGGPVEIIDSGVNGLLVPPGDVDALARTLQGLAGDLELRQRLGAAARVRAKDFAPGVIAARVVDAYRVLLAGRA